MPRSRWYVFREPWTELLSASHRSSMGLLPALSLSWSILLIFLVLIPKRTCVMWVDPITTIGPRSRWSALCLGSFLLLPSREWPPSHSCCHCSECSNLTPNEKFHCLLHIRVMLGFVNIANRCVKGSGRPFQFIFWIEIENNNSRKL